MMPPLLREGKRKGWNEEARKPPKMCVFARNEKKDKAKKAQMTKLFLLSFQSKPSL